IGKTVFEFSGDISIENITVSIKVLFYTINASTLDKEFPFSGNFKLVVKKDAHVNIDMGIKLLPGAEVIIEEGGEATITENGRVAIYDANEYVRNIGYPTGTTASTYRFEPNFTHGLKVPARLDNNGTLN